MPGDFSIKRQSSVGGGYGSCPHMLTQMNFGLVRMHMLSSVSAPTLIPLTPHPCVSVYMCVRACARAHATGLSVSLSHSLPYF